jgi:transposase-like protein
MTASLVARRHGVRPNQVWRWSRLERVGALTAAGAWETAVPAVDALLFIVASRQGSALSPATMSSFLPDEQQANKQDKHCRGRNSPCRQSRNLHTHRR